MEMLSVNFYTERYRAQEGGGGGGVVFKMSPTFDYA